MKRQIIFFFLIATLCWNNKANAQYEDLRFPQSETESNWIKTHKITSQVIYMSLKGSEAPYGIVKYDANGRITLKANQKSRFHYVYDDQGRLSQFLDSTTDGRRFWKKAYSFTYNEDGKLKSAQLADSSAIFNFLSDANTMIEQIKTPTGNSITREYTFTPEGKYSIIKEKDAKGEVYFYHKYVYNKYGDLAAEVYVKQTEKGADSTVIMNTYDSKGRLLRKQKINTLLSLPANNDESAAIPEPAGNISAPTVLSTRKDVFNYTYNNDNQTTTETMSSTEKNQGYKKEWIYDNFGTVIKLNNFNAEGALEMSFIYHYK